MKKEIVELFIKEWKEQPNNLLLVFDQIEVNYRIASKDGNYFILTRDYDPDRVNLHIDNDVVVKYNWG